MKQIVSVFRAALLVAVLALLAACSGSFIDPGHVDGLVSMGDGDFGGDYSGGDSDWDFDWDDDEKGGEGVDDDDDENEGGGGSNISPLSSGASYSQANAKLDEIISYCNTHPGTTNNMIKSQAETAQSTISSTTWNSMGSMVIPQINNLINALQ
jgi:hypothetical protein